MKKIEKIERETQREEECANHAYGVNEPLEAALAEGATSGLSGRSIPDIIRDAKARFGNRS